MKRILTILLTVLLLLGAVSCGSDSVGGLFDSQTDGDAYLISGKDFNDILKDKYCSSTTGLNIVFETECSVPVKKGEIVSKDLNQTSPSSIAWCSLSVDGETLYIRTTGKSFILNSNCEEMFSGLEYVQRIDFQGKVNTEAVTKVKDMFAGLERLKALNLKGFSLSSVNEAEGKEGFFGEYSETAGEGVALKVATKSDCLSITFDNDNRAILQTLINAVFKTDKYAKNISSDRTCVKISNAYPVLFDSNIYSTAIAAINAKTDIKKLVFEINVAEAPDFTEASGTPDKYYRGADKKIVNLSPSNTEAFAPSWIEFTGDTATIRTTGNEFVAMSGMFGNLTNITDLNAEAVETERLDNAGKLNTLFTNFTDMFKSACLKNIQLGYAFIINESSTFTDMFNPSNADNDHPLTISFCGKDYSTYKAIIKDAIKNHGGVTGKVEFTDEESTLYNISMVKAPN